MSTKINIKKRIAVLEESAIITADVNSIDFVGSGVNASSVGGDVTVTIPQADTLTDGYLSSTDWNTFNNKPDNLSQLNDVDIITTPLGDGEVLTYDGVSGLWKNEPPNSTPTNQVVLFADLGTTEALKACTYNNGTLGVGATLTGNVNGQLSTLSFTDRIDNVLTALNQIILIRSQSNQTQNGIYVVTQLGSPSQPFIITRTTDADTQAELYPLQVNVFGGATLANLAFLQKTVDPVIGLNNIVFTTTALGITNTPVLHVDTVTSAPLPTCTYTSGTNPTIPGAGAFLEATVNGTFPSINGVTLTSGRRFLVKDQVNQAHNGTYTVSNIGSATTKWRIFRADVWGSNFTVLDREWKVNNPSSTKYGARYSTNLLGLASTNIGITSIPFFEAITSASSAGIIYITNQTTGAVTYYTTLELASAGAVSGDTIYVNPGTYTVTTTATNGLAKSGVNWYFNQGAIVNKATTGHLFNDTGFANGITIDGSGVFNLTSLAYSFCYLTKTSYKINLYNVTSTTSYAIFDLSLLEGNSSTTIGGVGSININLNNATSSGGVVFTLNGSTSATQINIYFNMLKSTASYVLNGGNQTKLFLSGNLIYSTATYAIFGIQNYSVVVANVREINGVTYGWFLSGLGGSAYIESTSKTNGIYFNGSGSYFTQNAHCDTYYVVDGWVKGQSFINLTQTSGYFNGAYIGSNSAPAWSISGGVSEIDCRNNTVGSSRLSFNITGGKVFINGYYQEDSHTRSRVINGANAEVTFNNAQFICNGTAASEVYGGMIILTNGKLRLNNTKFQQGLTTYLEPLIKWTAGTVICNGFVATATNVYTNIFQATTAGLNLKVLSAGMSTSLVNNGGTVAAKKMKYKMTVSSVASTSITLNDGSGGNETFAESNTGVYSTTALLAQRIATLINVSATLDITATQDTPGTDVYFYIEMDTAGLAFTISALINLTSLQICMNSYLINNITGGTILENPNVE